MTTTAKPIELWIGTPKAYNSSFETLKQWLNTVQLYLLVNKDIYNNDDKKITFVLSYMTKGSALTWAAIFHENAIYATRTVILRTYSNFIAKFNEDFKQRDITGARRNYASIAKRQDIWVENAPLSWTKNLDNRSKE